ncbi:hypothetical protein TNCV_2566631 [Trichonephila clavipes]|uniref:Uncharacterized protein n=1 Tax=Trichonephila clavipes TaxID=2585209 RepID=A0A8X6WN19_TRICX|nr:hypothetical protein TNCV_2566631 [Trichonephila clavipes]
MSRLKHPPDGLVWKLREVMAAQVSSSSFDHGSNGRGPSPKALEYPSRHLGLRSRTSGWRITDSTSGAAEYPPCRGN